MVHEYSENARILSNRFSRKAFLPTQLRLGLGAILAFLSGLTLTAPALPWWVPPGRPRSSHPMSSWSWTAAAAAVRSYCSASVITRNVVLTAAHCVSDPSDTQVFFRGGEGQLVFFAAAWMAWILASVLIALLVIRFGRVRARFGIQAGLSLVFFGTALAFYLWSGVAAKLVFFDVAAIAINPGYRPNTGDRIWFPSISRLCALPGPCLLHSNPSNFSILFRSRQGSRCGSWVLVTRMRKSAAHRASCGPLSWP